MFVGAPGVCSGARSTRCVGREWVRERRRSSDQHTTASPGTLLHSSGRSRWPSPPRMATSHTQRPLHTGPTGPALCEVRAWCVKSSVAALRARRGARVGRFGGALRRSARRTPTSALTHELQSVREHRSRCARALGPPPASPAEIISGSLGLDRGTGLRWRRAPNGQAGPPTSYCPEGPQRPGGAAPTMRGATEGPGHGRWVDLSVTRQGGIGMRGRDHRRLPGRSHGRAGRDPEQRLAVAAPTTMSTRYRGS
jgi:hypothetical protein